MRLREVGPMSDAAAGTEGLRRLELSSSFGELATANSPPATPLTSRRTKSSPSSRATVLRCGRRRSLPQRDPSSDKGPQGGDGGLRRVRLLRRSIRTIAERAGGSPATLLQPFESKEGLLSALLEYSGRRRRRQV